MDKKAGKSLKKTATLLTVILISLSLLLAGCARIGSLKDGLISMFDSSRNEDKAVSVVNDFFNALVEDDLDTAYTYVYAPPQTESQARAKTREDFEEEFESITSIVSFEINWIEVKNNIAIAGIDLIDTYDGEEKIYKDLQISLILDNNQEWKINFWK